MGELQIEISNMNWREGLQHRVKSANVLHVQLHSPPIRDECIPPFFFIKTAFFKGCVVNNVATGAEHKEQEM